MGSEVGVTRPRSGGTFDGVSGTVSLAGPAGALLSSVTTATSASDNLVNHFRTPNESCTVGFRSSKLFMSTAARMGAALLKLHMVRKCDSASPTTVRSESSAMSEKPANANLSRLRR